jgi:hypothetical protein
VKRSPYFDNLRIVLTVLVFIHHTAIGYGASGGWCYITPENTPAQWNVALFILICGLTAFLLRCVYPIGGKNIIGLQLGYFTLYISYYILGIIARRKKWMDKLLYNKSILWFIAALAVIPLMVMAWCDLTKNPAHMVEYIGGFHWRSLFLSFWEVVVCVGICYFSIMAFKKYLNGSNTLSVNLAIDSYAADFNEFWKGQIQPYTR